MGGQTFFRAEVDLEDRWLLMSVHIHLHSLRVGVFFCSKNDSLVGTLKIHIFISAYNLCELQSTSSEA